MTEQFAIPSSNELSDALCDLREASDEAREEGFSLPSDLVLANANRLLREMYRSLPCRYEVFPTQEGEIAITAPGGFGRSIALLCNSDGGALCLVNIDGKHRRARYSTTDLLPDVFVHNAMSELQEDRDGVR